ncbi:MAG: hypothetical protein YSLV5_ORF26 [Yellowstone Lake virophage 5]|uniref:Uncharacterized protein n=1 Tax=Yellowstone Lake virophage 5 TaxID=1557033 RepID=A0A0A0RS14_9VIRU|nr:MAG: hypothetical protein ASQ69_gp26 [Yellowstone Lake virophage 5]AIW01884.1 MAG: hypothetical protein YSLV5_ORF26 [Yellowstone Lake virophage 5]
MALILFECSLSYTRTSTPPPFDPRQVFLEPIRCIGGRWGQYFLVGGAIQRFGWEINLTGVKGG